MGENLLMSPDPVGDVISMMVGSLLFGLLIGAAILILFWYLFYRVVKAAVRNGMIEATQRTGGLASGGTFVQGYPPPQDVGPPPAPTYRGPNG